jgi:hypothetical protein
MAPKKRKVPLWLVALCVVGGLCVLIVGAGIHTVIQYKDRTVARTNAYRLTDAVGNYIQHYKRYPSGPADEVIEELRGRNPDGVVFLELSSLMDGQLIDSWGEPYCLLRPKDLSKPVFYSKGPDRTDDMLSPDSDDLGNAQPLDKMPNKPEEATPNQPSE